MLLYRNTDYTIDYELGILTILRMLGPDDVVRVEYEYFRGPFGAVADYKSNFYGATFGWTPAENLNLKMDVAVYADDPRSAAIPEATPAMPNTHTIIGLTGQYDNKGLNLSADLAFSHDQFPFDDNRKVNAANRISGIIGAVDADEIICLDRPWGWNQRYGDGFRNYSIGSGLASQRSKLWPRQMRTGSSQRTEDLLCSQPFRPSGQNPFDYVSNWRRIYMSSGLPSNNLTSVAPPLECLVGTADKEGFMIWSIWKHGQYRKSAASGLPSDAITAIAYDPIDDLILVGSKRAWPP